MTDHVTRMVHGWLKAQRAGASAVPETRAVASLVDAIHRLIREAEDETRKRCEAAASAPGTRSHDAGEHA